MMRKLKYYLIPFNQTYEMDTPFDIPDLDSIKFESEFHHPVYGVTGIKPTFVHNNFEEENVDDTMEAVAIFDNGSELRARFYKVDINTNVFLNRYVDIEPRLSTDGTILDEIIGGNVTEFEAKVNYKVMKLPDSTVGVASVTSDTDGDYTSTSFFDSALKKLYIIGPMIYGESVDVSVINNLENLTEDGVEETSGFDIDNLFNEYNAMDKAKQQGLSPIPFGRWILFTIRLWLYLRIPPKLGVIRDSDELADTIVDYYKQTVWGAINIWGATSASNPGERGMRTVLKLAFRLSYQAPIPELMKAVEPMMKLAVMIFWFGAQLHRIPPAGSVVNVAAPVIFPGIPTIKLPTPNLDSTQFARELGFMFAIHSLTLFGVEIGLVPAGTSLVPVPYPWVALV